MHQYNCICMCMCICVDWTTQYNSCNNFGFPFFLPLFYDNIWPNYVYAAWAAGNENGKTGNNKVSDKSFPTVSVTLLWVCATVYVCVCEWHTYWCNNMCIKYLLYWQTTWHFPFYKSMCVCVCMCHTQVVAWIVSILPFAPAVKAETVSETTNAQQDSRKQLLEDVLDREHRQLLLLLLLLHFLLAWKIVWERRKSEGNWEHAQSKVSIIDAAKWRQEMKKPFDCFICNRQWKTQTTYLTH